MIPKKKCILVVSNEPWGKVWFSKHHYASELARLGHQVYFLNPPAKWKPWNLFSFKAHCVMVSPSLSVINYKNNLPIISTYFSRINDWLNCLKFKGEVQSNQLETIWWQFDPFRFVKTKLIPGRRIYHVTDEFYRVKNDRKIAEAVQIIPCTSYPHFCRYAQLYPDKAIYIPHGISDDQLTTDDTLPQNTILLIGTMNDDYDLDLLIMIAKTFEPYTLKLVGPLSIRSDANLAKFHKLRDMVNVHYEGPKGPEEIKKYISDAKVCITPYRFDMKRVGSPLKIFNYLGLKRPVVTSILEGFEDLSEKGVYRAENETEFISQLRELLENKKELELEAVELFISKRKYTILIDNIFTKLCSIPKEIERNEYEDLDTISKQNILIISNEPWGEVWYSKHNYAYELSKRNKVVFVNPLGKWKLSSVFTSRIQKEQISENLSLLSYYNPLPVRTNFLTRTNNWLVSIRLRKWLRKNGLNNFVVWSFDPFRLYDAKLLGARLGIYHCVDLYGFKYYGENQLSKKCDALFLTSSTFLDTYKQYTKPKFIVPHGISEEEFNLETSELSKLDLKETGYGLYTGVVDLRIDFLFLEKVLIEFKDVTFVFIGPLKLPESIVAHRIFVEKKYPNVVVTGQRHFKSLKYYIHKAKFCISFMDVSYAPNMIHHHKTLHYLAQGKPIFSPVFSEYKKNDHLFYMSNNHDDLLHLLSNFIEHGEDIGLCEKRIEFAREYTFERIFKKSHTFLNTIDNY